MPDFDGIPDRSDLIAALLATGVAADDLTVSGVAAGGNNRLFRIQAGGRQFMLKRYFIDPTATRSRLDAEMRFSRYAWDRGIRCIPEPICADPEASWALFAYVDATPFRPADLRERHVQAAWVFFRALQPENPAAVSTSLPNGAEACFSIAEHLATVERRVQNLAEIECADDVDAQAAKLVETRLTPSWQSVRDRVAALAGEHLHQPLAPSERCVSPSDFGFHNALRHADESVTFLDFEYAGWDDVAKVYGDFFNQPAVPVPWELRETALDELVGGLREPCLHRWRCHLLLGVYAAKWCCILLNEFLPRSRSRRQYAQGCDDWRQRRVAQLQKVQRQLARLDSLLISETPPHA